MGWLGLEIGFLAVAAAEHMLFGCYFAAAAGLGQKQGVTL
jgi:hypothetical protein